MSDGGSPDQSGSAPEPATDDAGYDVPNPEEKEFGWRGWILVGMLVVSFLVIPWSIIALPQAQAFLTTFGLGWRDAYLVLPLVPALILGALGVWTAVANRRR